jgi:hypothetical protein
VVPERIAVVTGDTGAIGPGTNRHFAKVRVAGSNPESLLSLSAQLTSRLTSLSKRPLDKSHAEAASLPPGARGAANTGVRMAAQGVDAYDVGDARRKFVSSLRWGWIVLIV